MRLIKRLDSAVLPRVVLISAPAGYGKTAFTCEWARSRKEQVSWIGLDEADDDPVKFFGYLRLALKKLYPELEECDDHLSSYEPTQLYSSLTILLNSLCERSKPGFIILDDYHQIKNPAVHDITAFLIRHLPSNLHFLILTRSDPQIHLDRLRIQNDLWEIRQNDLCFDENEVSVFLNRIIGLDLSKTEVTTLTERTEGWIAGIYMAALYLTKCEDKSGFISNFSGNHAYIMDYLVKEVFFRQPETIRNFLLESSILDHLSDSLCNELTGREDSAMLLEQLIIDNQFIVQLDEQRRWYRYHQLYGDVLQSLLKQQYPERLQPLYTKVCHWYERHNHLEEAIKYAFRGNDISLAVCLIEKCVASAMIIGERIHIRKWIEKLSESIISSRPLLGLVHAWSLMNDMTAVSDDLIRLRLRNAEQAISNPGEEVLGSVKAAGLSISRVSDTITLLKATLSFGRGNPSNKYVDDLKKSLEKSECQSNDLSSATQVLIARIQLRTVDFDAALKSLEETTSIAKTKGHLYLTIYATYLKAWVLYQKGKYHLACQVCEETIKDHTPLDSKPGQHLKFVNALKVILGAVYFEWNQLSKANRLLEDALKSLRLTTENGIIINAMVHQIFVKLALKFDSFELKKLIAQLEGMGRFHNNVTSLAAALEMNLSSILGNYSLDFENMEQIIGPKVWDFDSELHYYQDFEWHLTAQMIKIHIFIKRCKQENKKNDKKNILLLIGFLKKQMAGSEKWEMKRLVIETSILLSIVYELNQDLDQAKIHLGHALYLTAPEGAIRPFLDHGKDMFRLLHEMRNDGYYPEFIDDIFSFTDSEEVDREIEAKTDPILFDFPDGELTPRELEVLKLIADGCTNREIATQLFISLNTVKFHILRLYTKLDVHKRTQAVAKATSLGIL
ncbi:LuxR C-terminal-related transcriptional regulator [bacterium]|nr:LuxR C-terminal-related transcriptional regulator [bacterium]